MRGGEGEDHQRQHMEGSRARPRGIAEGVRQRRDIGWRCKRESGQKKDVRSELLQKKYFLGIGVQMVWIFSDHIRV